MDDALVLARLGLAIVFLVAGVAKLLDRSGTRSTLSDFEVPDRVAAPLGFLLPAAELSTSVALVFAPTAAYAGGLGLLLLVIFSIALMRALRRGETPVCHCFGQVHSAPVSWLTVARNAILALVAVYVAGFGPGPSLVAWVNGHGAQDLWLIAMSSLAAVATTTSAVLLRENRTLRSKALAPTQPRPRQIGSRAPGFSLPSVGGLAVSLPDLLAGERPCVLTFVQPGCGPCATLLPEIARWHDAVSDRLSMPVVTAGDLSVATELARTHGLGQVLADAESNVSRAYGVVATPCAVLVAADGSVRSAPAPGQVAIEALVRVALQGGPRPVVAGAV